MKLEDVAIIKTNFPEADFWITRRGSLDTVGKPTKEYNPESIGIKVESNMLLPEYMYYVFMHMHQSGVWKQHAHGATNLVNIKLSDVKNIPLR